MTGRCPSAREIIVDKGGKTVRNHEKVDGEGPLKLPDAAARCVRGSKSVVLLRVSAGAGELANPQERLRQEAGSKWGAQCYMDMNR